MVLFLTMVVKVTIMRIDIKLCHYNTRISEGNEMKKVVALLLAFVVSVSLCACGGGNKKAFEASKAAYDNVDVAYEITEQFGSDLYEAWRLGIYDDEEILEDGVKHLASELSLSEDEIKVGVAYVMTEIGGKEWSEISEEDKKTLTESADIVFGIMEDNLFSFCVMVVTGAYTANGKVEEAQAALNEAKSQMKELSQKYSDYEHYPNLKGYYTTTSSFFDFCQNPTGSFEQVKDTINDYKNEFMKIDL